jgi:hypothetical protein
MPTPEGEMVIGSAVERGSVIYVYNDKGRVLFSKPKGPQRGDGLKGYTGTTLNIQRGDVIYTYNEKGYQIFSISAR